MNNPFVAVLLEKKDKGPALVKRKKAPEKRKKTPRPKMPKGAPLSFRDPRPRPKEPDETKFDLLHVNPKGSLRSDGNRVCRLNQLGKRHYKGITDAIKKTFTPQWTWVNAKMGNGSKILSRKYKGARYVSPGKQLKGAALGTRIDNEIEMVTKFMRLSGLTLKSILEPNALLPKDLSVAHSTQLAKIQRALHRRTRVALIALGKADLVPWAAQVPVWYGREKATHIDVVCLKQVKSTAGAKLRFVLIELKSGCGGARYTKHNGLRAKAPFQDRFQSQQLIHQVQTLCNEMMYKWTYPDNPVHDSYILRVTENDSHLARLPVWIRRKGQEMMEQLDPVIPANLITPKSLTVAKLADFRYVKQTV